MSDQNAFPSALAQEEYCYLTTTGRVTGRPHEIEIWFGLREDTLYLLSGNQTSDWVKNLLKNPSVRVRIAKHTFTATARLVSDKEEELIARNLVAEKYQEWEEDKTLSRWAQTALPVAIDLETLTSNEASQSSSVK
jgi:deazaflavin-dependent oxidoreductase (nitroreductase family)